MSKSKAGKQDKHRRATAGKSKGLVATALVLSFLLAGVALAVGGGLWSARPAQKKQSENTTTPNAIENLSPGSPAKEYVYAGGRLIATEDGSQDSVVDFDSDHRAEIGFYRNGLWGFLKSGQDYNPSNAQFFSWGGAGLAPLYGDFDGDQKTDLAYILPASGGATAFYAILRSTTGYGFGAGQPLFVSAGFPAAADVPVVGDFDGDGKADPSMWTASTGVWTIRKSSDNYTSFTRQWGVNGDIPIVCDLDGDGTSDMGFYHAGTWGFLKSLQAFDYGSAQFFSWGGAGIQPVVGDFDGDGKADIGNVLPPAGGQSATYAIRLSTNQYGFGQVLFVPAGFPVLGDTPVVGDWDGDGKADPAIWRESEGVWIIPMSSTTYTTYVFAQWGVTGDIPIPNSTTQY